MKKLCLTLVFVLSTCLIFAAGPGDGEKKDDKNKSEKIDDQTQTVIWGYPGYLIGNQIYCSFQLDKACLTIHTSGYVGIGQFEVPKDKVVVDLDTKNGKLFFQADRKEPKKGRDKGHDTYEFSNLERL